MTAAGVFVNPAHKLVTFPQGQPARIPVSPSPDAHPVVVRNAQAQKSPTIQLRSHGTLAGSLAALQVIAKPKGAAPPPKVLPSSAVPSYCPPARTSHSQSPRLTTPPRLSRPRTAGTAQRSYSTGPLRGALAPAEPLVDRIIATLRDRGELKEQVVRCFNSVASDGKHLDISGLRHFRALLTQALRVPDQTFGDVLTDYVRFDFDGNGTLELNEVYKLVKFHLWEYSKKFGGCSAQVAIPFKSLAQAGYTTSKQLGKGSQGEVTLATDSSGAARCIKSYKKGAMTQHGLDMLKEEFEAMRLVGCDRLAQTFEIFQDSQCYYMVNEVYYGGDFQTLRPRAVAQNVDMDEDWWRTLIRQCLRALEFMHQQAMIHCDIKEPNMMLKTEDFHNPEVVLIDFGLSKAMGAGETGIWGGTFGYIPPETHEHKKWFPRGDIFSLGVVIFQLLTDKIPEPEIRLPVDKGLFLEGCRTLADVREVTLTRQPPLHLMSEYAGLMDLTGQLLEKHLSRRLRAPVALAHEWIIAAPQAALQRTRSKPLRSKHRMATPGIVDFADLSADLHDGDEDDAEEQSKHDAIELSRNNTSCAVPANLLAAPSKILMQTVVEGSGEEVTSVKVKAASLQSGSSNSSNRRNDEGRTSLAQPATPLQTHRQRWPDPTTFAASQRPGPTASKRVAAPFVATSRSKAVFHAKAASRITNVSSPTYKRSANIPRAAATPTLTTTPTVVPMTRQVLTPQPGSPQAIQFRCAQRCTVLTQRHSAQA